MPRRQQSAARQGNDGTLVASVEQTENNIDHGQAGADDEHGCIGRHARQGVSFPGIADDECARKIEGQVATG